MLRSRLLFLAEAIAAIALATVLSFAGQAHAAAAQIQGLVGTCGSGTPATTQGYAPVQVDSHGQACISGTVTVSGAGDASAANQTSQITQETAVNTVLGTVTASPTTNTVSERLKVIHTDLTGGGAHVVCDSGCSGGATGAGTAAAASRVTFASDAPTLTVAGAVTNAGTFATQAAQSGTWTVQPGNTANTTAWKVDGSAVTQPVSLATNQPAGNVASGAADSGNPIKVGGVYNSTLPTLTNGQRGDLQQGARGALDVQLVGNDATTPASIGSLADGGSTTNALKTGAIQLIYTGSTYDFAREVVNSANTTGTGIPGVAVMAQCDDTSPTALTENSFGNVRLNCTHHTLLEENIASGGTTWSYAAATGGISNTNTAVTMVASAGAGLRNYVAHCDVSSDPLGTATELAIRDGAAGAVLWRIKVGTAGLINGYNISFPTPLKGTAATLMEVVTLTASGTGGVFVNCQGYQAP